MENWAGIAEEYNPLINIDTNCNTDAVLHRDERQLKNTEHVTEQTADLSAVSADSKRKKGGKHGLDYQHITWLLHQSCFFFFL
jgi:hypothetical protein